MATRSEKRCSILSKNKYMNQNMEQKIEQRFQEIEVRIETEEQLKPLSISDLMLKEFKDTEWAVHGLIPSEGITAISGAPAAHKTWIILDLAIKASRGEILFDKFATSKMGVLIIDEENGERLLQKRFQKLSKIYDLPIYLLSLKGRVSRPSCFCISSPLRKKTTSS